jgi:hypothetical protein
LKSLLSPASVLWSYGIIDAATIYVIMTLANGEMETRAAYFPSLEKCEQMAAYASDHNMLILCRKYPRPIVIAC